MDFITRHLSAAQVLATNEPVKAAAFATGAALLPFLIIAYNDYRYYVSMGPHGLPDDWTGWVKQLRMSPGSRKDTTVPAPYSLAEVAKSNGPNSAKSFFREPLHPRSGTRPGVCGFVAPQRQLDQRCSEDMKRAMNKWLDALVGANVTLLQREHSRLEGPFPAVQLLNGSPLPPFLQNTRGELVHVHPPDGSTHLVLSLVDSAAVIENRWGQRHRLSGSRLTWGYTLIYAPRNDTEFAVWKDIVAAAARFSCAGLGDVQIPSGL